MIWRRFAEAMGHAEWTEDPRFTDQYKRYENRDALNAAITDANLDTPLAGTGRGPAGGRSALGSCLSD